MTNGPSWPAAGSIESLETHSAQLELLGHSAAFAKLVSDHMTDRRTVIGVPSLRPEIYRVPSELIEYHGFATNFQVDKFAAELTESAGIPDDRDPIPASWQFRADYAVNGNHYYLSSNGETTTLVTTNNEGSEVEYLVSNGLPCSLLGALSLAALVKRETPIDPDKRLPSVSSSNQAQLYQIMLNMGHTIANSEVDGYYQSTTHATIEMPEDDRVVLIEFWDTKIPRASGNRINYHMACQIFGGLPIEMASVQNEAVPASYPEQPSVPFRLAKRFAHPVPPDELSNYAGLEDAVRGDVIKLKPGGPTVAYEATNAAILGTLMPLLKTYGYPDEPPTIPDVVEDKLPDLG